jgi:hypothetical protein
MAVQQPPHRQPMRPSSAPTSASSHPCSTTRLAR